MATTLARPAGHVPLAVERAGLRAGGVAATSFSLAAAFALALGLAQSALLAYARLRLHHLIHLPPQIVWIAPVAYAALFAVPAAAGTVVGVRRPTSRWLSWLVGVLTFLATYSALQLSVGLYEIARLLLAAGLAIRAGTLVPRFERTLRWLAPRVALALALVCAALTAGVYGVPAWREHRALAALPAAGAARPNVILLIWDTVRASELGLYGFDRPTSPNLDRFAAAGVTFDQAIATAPWTLPSHAAMFTGRYPHELGVGWRRPLDGRYPTLAERLARHGYLTAGFVANTIYTAYDFGLSRGFAHYEDYRVTPGEFVLALALLRPLERLEWGARHVGNDETLGRKDAAEVNREFLRWLDRRPAGHPFFVFLNQFDAHEPYDPPARYEARFRSAGSERKPITKLFYQATPAQKRGERDAYDAGIAYQDAELGRLLDALRARHLLDNTIVVVASDHGEEFGEHGVFTHGNSLYLPSLHVPLVIVSPGRVPAGRRVPQAVSLRDLPATIMDLVGVPRPGFPGASLARFWNGAPPAAAGQAPIVAEVGHATGLPGSYPVSVGDMRSVVTGGLQLIVNGDRRQELYDLGADPWERHDLLPASSPPRAGAPPDPTSSLANGH